MVLQARGIGIGVLLTLLVLGFLIVVCSLLLIPHLLGRGLIRLVRRLVGRPAAPRRTRAPRVALLS